MSYFRFCAALVVGALTALSASAAQTKPNIVFILADDLGYTDLSVQGSKYYQSPNIDRMAKEGIRFTSGHTAGPNCQPTRAALMSGQYMPRTGVYTVGSIDRFDWRSRPLRPADNANKLPLDKVTIAQALKKEGYATAMFGKWHLGDDGEYHPSKRGFDQAIVSSGTHTNFPTNPQQDVPDDAYLADYLTDKGVEFIRAAAAKKQPFFLYLPHYGVHAPYIAKDQLIAKFESTQGIGKHNSPVYAAMIYSVDESVGKISALLDELGLAKNTLLIFSSDNGGVGGYGSEGLGEDRGITDNAPLRGGKGMLYEGGVRVPYIFRWPGRIPPGTLSDQTITTVDLYPTLLEVAGLQKPKDYILDGVSFWNVLTSGGKADLKRPGNAIYWHFPGYLGAGAGLWRTKPAGAMLEGDWKFIEFFEDNRQELYNLKSDIGEKNNLALTNPEKTRELAQKLASWRKELKAPMPTPNKPETAPAQSAKKKKKKKAE
jgi:arylsulfatase A-like enzyme